MYSDHSIVEHNLERIQVLCRSGVKLVICWTLHNTQHQPVKREIVACKLGSALILWTRLWRCRICIISLMNPAMKQRRRVQITSECNSFLPKYCGIFWDEKGHFNWMASAGMTFGKGTCHQRDLPRMLLVLSRHTTNRTQAISLMCQSSAHL